MAQRAIFITGAASGIGLATARRFAREGWLVGLADIDEVGLAKAVAELGPDHARAHSLDVRDRAAWTRELEAFAVAAGGRLDVLVNNAGVARGGFLETLSDADVDLQIDVNLKGVLNGCRAALPHLVRTPGSVVVNMASVAALVGPARMSVYAASKFAVRGLSEALDLEWSREGVAVRVRCILPWFLDTPLLDTPAAQGANDTLRAELARQRTPVYRAEDAAVAVWRAVHGARLHHLVGAQAKVTALLARFAPGVVRKRLRARLAGGS